ncbi:hypothetical protein BABINDRAFT_162206 [Babjeviella inositovora NRRL Y-12698]|uniref:UBX domain-containing protein n=1 Tax=Babjeviella inositovora NRRL Y-12698 TaxID=984486 RepID=A0A1E3QND8_9ASCO|nr:uncharacterized protein BABINDRAFT_162206 [Babjeviella inositovora NRRL Y-12698]ODQ79150.1 hypothetical protein BABINDRAFT_162206 [Babjeviella inositovora NRRL Y-12698]
MSEDISALFQSSVNSAVQSSLSSKKPLFVFVTDESATSSHWLQQCVTPAHRSLVDQHSVTLRLVKGSVECGLFELTFGETVVPSIYIVRLGQPLETIHVNSSEEEIQLKIAGLKGDEEDARSTSTPLNSQSDAPSTLLNSQSNVPSTPLNSQSDTPLAMPSTPANPVATPPPAKPRKYSTLKEEAAETASSIYREQQAKERAMAKLDKERILKLLAADKEERKARERRRLERQGEVMEAEEDLSIKEVIRKKQHDSCALHIKLLNGATLTAKFEPQQTLNDVRNWVDEHRDDGEQPYTFVKAVPKVNYGDGDELSSLAELDLLPRSALLLKPVEHEVVSSFKQGEGWLSGLVSGVFSYWGGSNDDDLEEEDSPNVTPDARPAEDAGDFFQSPVERSRASTPTFQSPLMLHDPASVLVRSTSMLRSSSSQSVSQQPHVPSNLHHSNSMLSFGDLTSGAPAGGTVRERPTPISSHNSSVRIRTLQGTGNNERLTYNGNQLNLEDDRDKKAAAEKKE